jgi:hypothetical protein
LAIFLKKNAPKSFGRYFSEKNAPNAKKYRPNGEISPNLVTLLTKVDKHPLGENSPNLVTLDLGIIVDAL